MDSTAGSINGVHASTHKKGYQNDTLNPYFMHPMKLRIMFLQLLCWMELITILGHVLSLLPCVQSISFISLMVCCFVLVMKIVIPLLRICVIQWLCPDSTITWNISKHSGLILPQKFGKSLRIIFIKEMFFVPLIFRKKSTCWFKHRIKHNSVPWEELVFCVYFFFFFYRWCRKHHWNSHTTTKSHVQIWAKVSALQYG